MIITNDISCLVIVLKEDRNKYKKVLDDMHNRGVSVRNPRYLQCVSYIKTYNKIIDKAMQMSGMEVDVL